HRVRSWRALVSSDSGRGCRQRRPKRTRWRAWRAPAGRRRRVPGRDTWLDSMPVAAVAGSAPRKGAQRLRPTLEEFCVASVAFCPPEWERGRDHDLIRGRALRGEAGDLVEKTLQRQRGGVQLLLRGGRNSRRNELGHVDTGARKLRAERLRIGVHPGFGRTVAGHERER